MKLSLEEIAKLIGASVHGEPSKEILGINTLSNASSDQISYAVSMKYKKSLIKSEIVTLTSCFFNQSRSLN